MSFDQWSPEADGVTKDDQRQSSCIVIKFLVKNLSVSLLLQSSTKSDQLEDGIGWRETYGTDTNVVVTMAKHRK